MNHSCSEEGSVCMSIIIPDPTIILSLLNRKGGKINSQVFFFHSNKKLLHDSEMNLFFSSIRKVKEKSMLYLLYSSAVLLTQVIQLPPFVASTHFHACYIHI